MKRIISKISKHLIKYKKILLPFALLTFMLVILIDCKTYFHKQTENAADPQSENKDNEITEKAIINNSKTKEEFMLYFYGIPEENSNPEIRVLLSNPKGGYYFDEIVINNADQITISWDMKSEEKRDNIDIERIIRAKDFPMEDAYYENQLLTFAEHIALEKICTISSIENKPRMVENQEITSEQTSNQPSYGIHVSNIDQKNPFEGCLEIYRNQNGLFIVNVLPIEDYLKYVVPGEMPASYPRDALMAQAICARTYGYKSLSNPYFSQFYANVDDTTKTQVYHTKDISDSTSEAIKQTTGMYLEQDGNIADIYYYSTSWGQSADTDIWNTFNMKKDLNYQKNIFTENEFKDMITSVNLEDPDYGEMYYRWKYVCENIKWSEIYSAISTNMAQEEVVIFTNGILDENPKTSSKEFLQDIRILERGSGGCVIRLEIETNKHSYLIMGEYNIRKLLYSFHGQCFKGNGEQAQNLNLLPSGFFYLENSYKKGQLVSFVIYGGGLGHGIGMSQNGAKNLAGIGYNYQDILKYYYNECHILNRM